MLVGAGSVVGWMALWGVLLHWNVPTWARLPRLHARDVSADTPRKKTSYLLYTFVDASYASSNKQSHTFSKMNVFMSRCVVGISFGIPDVVPDEWKITDVSFSRTTRRSPSSRPPAGPRPSASASIAGALGRSAVGAAPENASASYTSPFALLAASSAVTISGEKTALKSCGT